MIPVFFGGGGCSLETKMVKMILKMKTTQNNTLFTDVQHH